MTMLTIELEYADEIPEELKNDITGSELAHVTEQIEQGYNQGELVLSYNDGQSQYRGWWRVVWN